MTSYIKIPATVSIVNNKATITPTNLLDFNTDYKVIVSTSATDIYGQNPSIEIVNEFRSKTLYPLAVDSIDPMNNSINNSILKQVEITFNNPIEATGLDENDIWIEYDNLEYGFEETNDLVINSSFITGYEENAELVINSEMVT